ncbi:hypothetical protein C7999DRAFT_17994 [Corynascus novoguineensis]|uniref:SnoaL-like domain-containing protein n=1 Tax=Corynascus novoguineensis TaxID=1126955 RepID=A0AAN7CKB7_9PEZI|nr:hypothetical protein C7999DRAFT_17994 [Corynascus novoguineensis]
MRISALLLTSLVSLCLGAESTDASCMETKPDVYEAIHQREAKLALTLDTKDWDRLSESMTQDIVYDSRPLGPDYGGLSVGLEEVIENTKRAFGDANVAHHVSNAVIRLNCQATEANVTTYVVWSRWEPNALHDPKKTFRIYERCDDVFVVDDGNWKLKYSLVTNLAPKVENPYFNDDTDNE